MKKQFLIKSIFCAAAVLCISPLFAETKQNKVKVELANVGSVEGKILVSVYDSAKNFSRKSTCRELKVTPTAGTTVFDVEIPDGEYLFCICHDVNDSGALDEGFFGIPKEPVAMNNYNGKSVPKFDKLKVNINGDTTIPMELLSF